MDFIHQEVEDMSILNLNVNLDSEQAQKLAVMARARNTTIRVAAAQLVTAGIDHTRHQGPGHTRREITQILAQTDLIGIVDPERIWDESDLDRAVNWLTNRHGERLLPEFAANTWDGGHSPYHDAQFAQNPDPPHGWQAYLTPATDRIGELGDIPPDLFPHPTLAEAAGALYRSYVERHGPPSGPGETALAVAQDMRQDLQTIPEDLASIISRQVRSNE